MQPLHKNKNRRRSLAPAAVVALIAGACAVGMASPASAVTSSAHSHPDELHYVALGDSYAAGFGLTPYSSKPAHGCYQAANDYPHQVAAELGLSLNDRACAGAQTANVMSTPQVATTGRGPAPVQADALSADTDIVTISIGGNDLGFTDVIQNCIASAADGPLLLGISGDTNSYSHCKDYYAPTVGGTEKDALAARIHDTVAPRLAQTFRTIAQRAPKAKVFVVGYPTIFPDKAVAPHGCFSSIIGDSGLAAPFPKDSVPFTDTDVQYLHSTQVTLDKAIQAAAQAQGFTYVSTLDGSAAHSVCAPGGNAWISGITLTDQATPKNSMPIAGTNFGALLGAMHPNAAGVANLRDQTVGSIVHALCGSRPASACHHGAGSAG